MRLHRESRGAAPLHGRPATLLAAALFVALAACGGDTTDPGGGNNPSVSTVEVSAGATTLEVGASVQLTAIAKDASGNLVTGKTFAWTSSNNAVATVTPSGNVTGQTTGTATIFASTDGKSGSVQVSVTAPTIPTISAVSPSPLVAGQPATLTGTNFSPTPSSNIVTVGGAIATVTAATATSLTVTVPASLCVPGTAGVQVTVNGRASNTIQQPAPSVGTSVATAVGQQTILSNPSEFCLQFSASSASEAYLVGIQSVTESGSTLTNVTVGGAGATSSPEFAMALPEAPLGFADFTPGFDDARFERWRRHRLAEIDLRRKERAQLDYSAMADFIRSRSATRGAAGAITSAAIPATVAVGDQVPIRVPLRSGNLCTDFTAITTVVKAVGTRSVWLEDTANPTNGFTAADYTSMVSDFDTRIYPTDTDYFGQPTDLDNNSRIVIVVTKEVNKAGVLGFATTADLRPRTGSGGCPSSDEGEIFYDRAPDPNAAFGDAYTREAAVEDAAVLLAHEFTHIIQFSVRPGVAGNQGLGRIWELEGQATFAEEVVGHTFTGRSPGQNYGFNVAFNCADPPGCSAANDQNDWYIASFIDLILYYGFNANCTSGDNTCLNTQLPGAPNACTWLELETTGPCYPGREVYGTPWSFYRWLADHYSSNFPGGEKELMKKMIANAFVGFATVANVIGRPIDELLAGWAAALYTDDRITSGTVDPRLNLSSWSFPDINSRLRTSATLVPRDRSFGTFTDAVQVRGGSTAYFRLSGAGRPAASIRIRASDGSPLPGFFRVFIVRMQ